MRGTRYLVRWIEPEGGANRSKTFRRLEEARTHRAKLRQDLERGEYSAPVKIGYDEWVKRHLVDLRNSPDVDLAPKTIGGHAEALAALRQACRPKSPADITPKTIRRFRQNLTEKGLAARTVNKHIAAIRSALSYAVRAEVVHSNRLLGPHRLFLREQRKPPRILEVGEVVALMNLAEPRLRTVISLAFYHGLRKGEIAYLQWQDVDLESKRLDIVSREGIHRTKTRTNRSIALRDETAVLLSQLYSVRVNTFVFESPKAFYESSGKAFVDLVKNAGIDHCTLHDLRKTCNTLMKDAGVSAEAAMQVLGHSSAQVNERFYTGILTEQQRIAVNALPSVG